MKCLFLVLAFLLVVSLRSVHAQDGFAILGDGTTGGAGGSSVLVYTEEELRNAVEDDLPRIIRIARSIELENVVHIGSNKSILGASRDAQISAHGLYIRGKRNIIIRGLRFCCAVYPDDGIKIEASNNIWIDHNDFSGDFDYDRDLYEGLVIVSNGSDYITFSWNVFHDHIKTTLIGASEATGDLDIGKLRVTFHHNHYRNIYSRAPRIRFGTAHVYNNFYQDIEGSVVQASMGAEVFVESNVFQNTILPIITSLNSTEDGYAVHSNNDFGGAEILITQDGSFTLPPYSYIVNPTSEVAMLVQHFAGPTIIF